MAAYDRTGESMKTVCRIIFLVFSLFWLVFFQTDLEAYVHSILTGNIIEFHPVLLGVIFALIVTFLEIPVSRLLGFSGAWEACNYIPSAMLLGICTGYTDEYLTGHSPLAWVFIVLGGVVATIILKMLSELTRVGRNNHLQTVSLNLFLMFLVMLVTPLLANTDENMHREMRTAHYMQQGDYARALKVGREAEETTVRLAQLRADCMAKLQCDGPDGSALGEMLFTYSLPSGLSGAVLSDSCSAAEAENRHLASLLLMRELKQFSDCITLKDSVVRIDSWKGGQMPVHYMEALLLEGSSNELLMSLYPSQTDACAALLEEYRAEPQKYRKTFWYYYDHH